jgi:putative transposase
MAAGKIQEMPRGRNVTLYKNTYRVESARLPDWDYSAPGYYFVTICSFNRQCIFGEIFGTEMILNDNGEIVLDCINQIPTHFENTKNDTWIIMPNHAHGIIQLVDSSNFCRDVACNVSTNGDKYKNHAAISPKPNSLSAIIRSFKSAVTNKMHAAGFIGNVWQSRFHDHIVRNVRELFAIRQYIKTIQ